MATEIIISLITLLGSALGTFGGIFVNSKLTAYRIEQLENARLGLSLADVVPDELKSVPTVPKSEAI